VDQVYAGPVLKRFEVQTGINVLPVYDVEAAKTTGLANRIIAEAGNPQADVYWSGEFAQTISLETPEGPPETVVFLYGAQRLFLLAINRAQLKIGQMAGKTQARLWLGDLLARARQMPLNALYPTDQTEYMEATMIASPPLNLSQPPTPQTSQAVKFCTACGARLNMAARFCGECGAKVGA